MPATATGGWVLDDTPAVSYREMDTPERTAKGSPDQPRDDHGRWTSDGGGTSQSAPLSHQQHELLADWVSGDATVYHDLRKPRSEMTALLAAVPEFDGVSYRGVTLNDKDLVKLVNAKGVKIDLHSSASVDERIAQNFMSIADESHLGHDKAVLIEFHGRAADLRPYEQQHETRTEEVVVRAGTVYRFERLTHERDYTRITLREKR